MRAALENTGCVVRYGSQGMPAREQKVMEHLIRHRIERRSRLRKLFYDCGERVANRRLVKLVQRYSEGNLRLVKINQLKEECIAANSVLSIIHTHPEHDLIVSDLRSAFLNSGMLIEDWYSEFDIRTRLSVKDPSYSFLKFCKIPDAIFVDSFGKKYLMELENTQKSSRRIDDAISGFESMALNDVKTVFIFCRNRVISNAYNRSLAEYAKDVRIEKSDLRCKVINLEDCGYDIQDSSFIENKIRGDFMKIDRNSLFYKEKGELRNGN